jgi:exosortase
MSRVDKGFAAVAAPLSVGLAIFATLGIWVEIWSRALTNPEDSHIFMALPIAVWLAWLRRSRLRRWKPTVSITGPIMIAVGWAMVFSGYRFAFDVLQHFGALLTVVGALVAVLGHRILFLLKPSLIALLFLFPVPGRFRQHIAIPLQHASAAITENILTLSGIAIERTGILLNLNGHEVAVAEACNGMRMVTALGLITIAFVFSVPMRSSVRLLLLTLTPLFALVVNTIRLVPTSLAYGYWSNDAATLVHDIGGWAVLGFAVALLWLTLVTLRWLEIPVSPYPIAEVRA